LWPDSISAPNWLRSVSSRTDWTEVSCTAALQLGAVESRTPIDDFTADEPADGRCIVCGRATGVRCSLTMLDITAVDCFKRPNGKKAAALAD